MKKFISMALALVMTLSLCTFIAVPEADAFDDTDDLSQYAKQAIDVIKEIQVMDGTSETEFAPDAQLTRQAAAKIICNMILGPVTASALPTNESPFPDVPADGKFTGYIAYCAHEKIISGYSDGSFKPTGALTGYAFLKMLLGALGYDGSAEGFTGANWKVNVAKIALGIGLTKGSSDPDGEYLEKAGVKRWDAAVYAFNTLQGDLVEYPSQNSINVNGVTVSMGSGKASPQTWTTSSTSANNINARRDIGISGLVGGTYTGYPIVQFAERYFDKLVREPNEWDTYTTDEFGRPSIKWYWKGVKIGTYPNDPDAIFEGNVKVNAIYEALEYNSGMSSGTSDANLYINSSEPNRINLNVARGNDTKLADEINKGGDGYTRGTDTAGGVTIAGRATRFVDRIGNSTRIECFRNRATNHVDVCAISMYGGKVSSVKPETAKRDRYVTIDWADDFNNDATVPHYPRPDTMGNATNSYDTEDFDEDDVVWYTYSDSARGIQDMGLLSDESGQLQTRVQDESLRLDDVTYVFGKEFAFHDVEQTKLSNRSSYVVYLFTQSDYNDKEDYLPENYDNDEWVLWVEEDEFAVDQYVLIERIRVETPYNKTSTSSVITGLDAAQDYQDFLPGGTEADQRAIGQLKIALGSGTWGAEARVRTSTGSLRTITLDDSKNYRTSDGNWISNRFTAGNIVRCTQVSGGAYKLHAINSDQVLRVTGFGIHKKTLYTNAYRANTEDIITYDTKNNVQTDPRLADNGKRINADADTYFVIEDTYSQSWKTYVGIKNTPNVADNPDFPSTSNATAYIYHRNGLAKLIYVRNGRVSSSTSDILFILANTASKRIRSDIDDYFSYRAVNKGVITTVNVKAGIGELVMSESPRQALRPGYSGNDAEEYCVILNNVNYDSNGLLTDGKFDVGAGEGVFALKAQGIRRINDEEIRVGTIDTASSIIRDLSESVKVFYMNEDDELDQIDVEEIVNDNTDMVYYILDNGQVTYLFIVEYAGVAAQAVATNYYYDGQLTYSANDNGALTHFDFHYDASKVGEGSRSADTIQTALARRLNVAKADIRLTEVNDKSYTAVSTTLNASYTITLVDDALRSVEGHYDGRVSDISSYHKPVYNDADELTGYEFVVGSPIAFTITPDEGYRITDVKVTREIDEADVGLRTTSDGNGAMTIYFDVPSSAFRIEYTMVTK